MGRKRRVHTVAFKHEVILFLRSGNSINTALKHFSSRDKCTHYTDSLFRNWKDAGDSILAVGDKSRKRIPGGGRKPVLGELEEVIKDEIIEMRIQRMKVTRSFIADRARVLAEENHLELKASNRWLTNFMRRYNFTLRRTTNLTTLTTETLVQRAVDYMTYLRTVIPRINPAHTLLMDETALYFEDDRCITVELKGRKHVVMKSTGFASMRITVVPAVWVNGEKAPPLVINKSTTKAEMEMNGGGDINRDITGPLLYTTQNKAWVNENFIIKWLDALFPIVLPQEGKCVVWDSCRAHISRKVKDYCRRRNIQLVVIPGGLTPYLQAGDIGLYKEFKDNVCKSINAWKHSDQVEYTRGGNPKPPAPHVVRSWVKDGWYGVSRRNVERCIASAGFSANHLDWHIAKHDIYGQLFRDAWDNSGPRDVNPDDLEE